MSAPRSLRQSSEQEPGVAFGPLIRIPSRELTFGSQELILKTDDYLMLGGCEEMRSAGIFLRSLLVCKLTVTLGALLSS